MGSRKSVKRNSRKGTAGIIVLFAIGLLVLFYPQISNTYNQIRADHLISTYQSGITDTAGEKLDRMFEEARAYNREHKVNTSYDAFSDKETQGGGYDQLLDPMGNGIMGYIEIPDIKVKLPIYHGTSEKVLEKGAGHLSGTSLPAGGKGSHCVLAGHRGLPSAKLFTDLDRMEEGDIFFLHILDRLLAYEVDSIDTVKPDNVKKLEIQEGKDLVTLVTCTPYGVNSHRLLVRGHRVKYEPGDDGGRGYDMFSLLLWGLVILLNVILLIYFIRRNRKKKGI